MSGGEVAELPVLGSAQLVMFPGMRCAVHLHHGRAARAVEAAISGGGVVGVFAARAPEALHDVGTAARVVNYGMRSCCGRPVADLQGMGRVRLVEWARLEPHRVASCVAAPDPAEAPAELEAVALAIAGSVRTIRAAFPRCQHVGQVAERLAAGVAPAELAGVVAPLLGHLSVAERQRLLELEPLSARLGAALEALVARLHRASASPRVLH